MRMSSLSRAYMASLSLVAFAGAVFISVGQWNKLTEVAEAEAAVRVLQPAIKFVEVLALERGAYNQAIAYRSKITDDKLHFLAASVASTNEVFSETLKQIDKVPSNLAEQFRAPVLAAQKLVKAARAESDRQLQTSEGMSPERAKILLQRFHEAFLMLNTMLARVNRTIAERSPSLGLILEISRLSNDIRELAGERNVFLSRYILETRSLDSSEVEKVAQYSGALLAHWQRMERIAGEVQSSGAIADSVALVRTRFFETGEPIFQKLVTAARTGARPDMDFATWRPWTLGMLSSVLAARDAPILEAIRQTRQNRADAILHLVLALSAMGGAIIVVIGSALLVERKFVRPVSRLTAAIDDVAEMQAAAGDGDHHGRNAAELEISYGARKDEIGSLARALSRLRLRSSDLIKLNQRFDVLLTNLSQGLVFYDAQGHLLLANARFIELYELHRIKVRPGVSVRTIEGFCLANGLIEEGADEDFDAPAKPPRDLNDLSPRVVETREGRLISVSSDRMPGGGWIETHEDITERRRVERRIAHMAHHDALTDLPNRVLFHDEMQRAFRAAQHGETLAIMCLDLDRFKAVNDTLGHAAGDELLTQVSLRLRACLRNTDLVARLGGDEFAVICSGQVTPEHLTTLAQRLIDHISEVYDLDGHTATIGTSIGIAIGPQDGANAYALLKAADLALYRAKSEGRGTYRFFEAQMDAHMQQRHGFEQDLRKALELDEFELHYQPIMDLGSDCITGFEALLRWNHPVRGRVAPLDFIPLAEEIGLISDIGAWVLRQACTQAMSWPKHLTIAVNLSPKQFASQRLLYDVTGALNASGLFAGRLELEITEQVVLEQSDFTMSTLNQLRELGVRISMDDFGTGYSSLSYLSKFPFDKIKIDQSFIRNLKDDPASMSIIRAVIGLGRGHVMSTTAEGVETEEQLSILRAEGCTQFQGYLLAKPMPADEVEAFLSGNSEMATSARSAA